MLKLSRIYQSNWIVHKLRRSKKEKNEGKVLSAENKDQQTNSVQLC